MLEQSLEAWDRFAKNAGAAATEFLRRFSVEQQKACVTWMRTAHEAARPLQGGPNAKR